MYTYIKIVTIISLNFYTRTFSTTMKILKNYLRNSLDQERRISLALLNVHRLIIINPNYMIDCFAKEKKYIAIFCAMKICNNL